MDCVLIARNVLPFFAFRTTLIAWFHCVFLFLLLCAFVVLVVFAGNGRLQDKILYERARQFGSKSWPSVAAAVGHGVTPDQCRVRFTDVLSVESKGLKVAPWTDQEVRE